MEGQNHTDVVNVRYGYTPASNRMATGPPGAVVLDAAGNTLAIGAKAFAYNQAGRLVSTSGAAYTYRHDGLRASKTVNGTTTLFHYDATGWLIAETDAAGATLREYVWDDEVPVAQVAAGAITYLHTDPLGTPRLGTNTSGAVVWRWDSGTFGTGQPTGVTTVNLRFPGQYFDAETGLHYNGQRTFDPASGRYLESDPIGLAGGIDTYGYVEGNPLAAVDPDGRIGQFVWALRVLAPVATAMLEANSVAIGEPPLPGVGVQACGKVGKTIGPTVGDLRAAGLKDAHHIIQDASVRDIRGYRTNTAPGVVLEGPSNLAGTPHNLATSVQRQAGGGTYAAERRIGYKALRRSGLSAGDARSAIGRADAYFQSIGVSPGTVTRIPGNR